jgi:hypothetical protein
MPLPWEGRKEEEVQKTPEDQAIEQLIPHIRDRLKALFDEGTLRKGDLDLKSIVTLGSLQEPLQVKVMEHMENDRVFLANARSKSGFLIAATDKAKRGELDVRGFGAIDPWKATLEALKCRHYSWVKWRAATIKPEEEFLESVGGNGAMCKITIDSSVQPPEGKEPMIELELPYISTIDEVKDKIVEAGVFIPKNNMQVAEPVTIGVLRAVRTLAFYNIANGAVLKLKIKKRGGVKHRIDAKVLEFGG